MKAAFVIGAIAATAANAWKYPDCEHDNCYNNLVDKRGNLCEHSPVHPSSSLPQLLRCPAAHNLQLAEAHHAGVMPAPHRRLAMSAGRPC